MGKRRRKALPSEPIELNTHAISHDGRGIAKHEDRTVFITGALNNEAVQAQLINRNKNFFEAIATNVIKANPERVDPKCSYFLNCGGCRLQHMSTEAQLKLKQETLLEQLKHFGNTTSQAIFPPMTGPAWGYRTKARLGARYVDKKEKMLVGFREINSRYLADIDHCEVLHPNVGLQLDKLAHLIKSLSIYRDIPQIEVAVGENATAFIVRHLKPFNEDDIKILLSFAEDDIWIYSQPGNASTVHRIQPKGEDFLYYMLPDHHLKLYFHPTDFTQVNVDINKQMINRALELLELNLNDIVLDLFCGLGNFTLPIAKYCKQVVGVEGSITSVSRAKYNAEQNNIKNAEFHNADLTQDFSHTAWARQSFTKLVLDPPRTGAQEIVEQIEKFNADRVVYISCNPATLARDAGILTRKGYQLAKIGIMDMFPHTAHVETIALFVKD